MRQKLTAEFVGSAFLALIVVGSGMAAQSLSPRQPGLELLVNAAATGAGLFVLISIFGTISGAHFNPLVTIFQWIHRRIASTQVAPYAVVQTVGCVSGTLLANVMFGHPAIEWSTHHRQSLGHAVSEVVATAGLLVTIELLLRARSDARVPAAVGSYIASAYFFASSTSFANPAITVGRMFTNSFAGISPSSAPAFVGSQILGAAVALLLLRMLSFRASSEGVNVDA